MFVGENVVLVNNRIFDATVDAFRLVDNLREEITKACHLLPMSTLLSL